MIYGEYIKEFDEAKKMNDRINVITDLFNGTNKGKEYENTLNKLTEDNKKKAKKKI